VRYDWNVREADQVFVRYSYGHDDSTTTSRLPTFPAGTSSGTNFNRSNGVVLAYTHTFSPRLLNEARFGFTRVNCGNTPPFANTRLAASLGIPGANPSPLLGGGALIGGFNSQIEYSGSTGIRRWEPSVFAQDDWRIARRLTLNIGLRYDIFTVPVEVEDRRPTSIPHQAACCACR
jgi:outer membrane receptor protein involved in Fe transport